MKIHNFSAGPCILPQEVFNEASESLIDFDNLGLSVVEISHRSKSFVAVMDEAVALTKELLHVPDTHEVIFLQGGASMQFIMVAFNLLTESGKAQYLDTGAWSSKAYKEAAGLGKAEVLASSKDSNYNYIPKGYTIDESADYFHCTSNNTIYGTQIKDFPDTRVPVVADMSSDIFSRSIDVKDFDLIYAGAQKNLGPAGATLVIVRKNALGRSGRYIPTMLDYTTHISKGSMFNTPPVFSVYVSMLTLRWLKANGGVETIAKRNDEKASLLYQEIDRNSLFAGTAAIEDRSTMNACFLLNDEGAHKEYFDKLINTNQISGINGHRSVGGYRASMYNAMDIESVQVLVNCMQELEKKYS
jgi:phosphoserine aminotransferase